MRFIDDIATLNVIRDGVELEVKVRLCQIPKLVPVHYHKPPYLIVGGLVFTMLSEPYMRSEFGNEYEYQSPVKLLNKLYHGITQQEGEQVFFFFLLLIASPTYVIRRKSISFQ